MSHPSQICKTLEDLMEELSPPGLFLANSWQKEYLGHLDMAGPAFSNSSEEERTKGGTGFGVRLLIDLARNFRKPDLDGK